MATHGQRIAGQVMYYDPGKVSAAPSVPGPLSYTGYVDLCRKWGLKPLAELEGLSSQELILFARQGDPAQ